MVARRDFAGFPDGTHTPGYRGFCPQMRYRCGKTYGQETHELAQYAEHVHPVNVTGPSVTANTVFRHQLTEPTGDNKYTRAMVPGYSGKMITHPTQTFNDRETLSSGRYLCFYTGIRTNEMDFTRYSRVREKNTLDNKITPI